MRNSPILSTDVNTTRVIDVNSSAGFAAGDLVYLQNGNGTSTPATTSSVTFQASDPLPMVISAHTGSAVLQAFDNTTSPNRQKNAASNGKCAAVLTNGNIVHVVMNDSPSRVYFTIQDANGATVVAFTAVSAGTTAANACAVSVCALTGGGFVVGWYEGSSRPTYAIFDNNGTVVLAETTYTGETTGNTYYAPLVTALPNGNWVYTFYSATNSAIRFRIFGPTGTAISTWTTVLNSGVANSSQFDVAVKSDSSMVFAFNVSTYFYLSNYDSTGTSQGSNAITPTGVSVSISALSLATMSDGATVRCAFTYYNTNSPYWTTGYLSLTGTTPSALTYLPGANLTQNTSNGPSTYTGPQSVCIFGLAAGAFLIAYQDMTTTIGYSVFSSTGTCLTGTNTAGAVPVLIYGSATGYLSRITAIEVGDYINLYYVNGYYGGYQKFQCLSKINKTTYALYYPYTVNQAIGSISTTPGAYVSNASKPTQAVYTTASTFTSTVNKTVGLVTDGNTAVAGPTASYANAALIKDGSIICAEVVSATIYVSRYSSSGVLLSNIATITGTSGGQIRVRALDNGGFVLMYNLYDTTAGQYYAVFNVYNSSYALTTTFTNTDPVATSGTWWNDFDILKSQNIVYVYENNVNGYTYYKILSLTGTVVVTSTTVQTTATPYNIQVCAGVNDSFWLHTYISGVNYPKMYSYIRTGATAWTQIVAGQQASYSGYSEVDLGLQCLPSGTVMFYYRISGTSGYIYVMDMTFNNLTPNTPAYPSSGAGNSINICLTAIGSIAYYSRIATSNRQCIGFIGNGGYQQIAYQFPATNLYTNTALNDTNNTASRTMCAAGLTNWFLYFNYSSVNKVSLVTSLPFSVNHTFTKDVALCDPLSIYPNSTSASGIIPNCPLIGVALTAAPAGGVGRVVSSGATTLNSNYSATTPFGNFDHQTYGGLGVKGSISGRTVTLTGNL